MSSLPHARYLHTEEDRGQCGRQLTLTLPDAQNGHRGTLRICSMQMQANLHLTPSEDVVYTVYCMLHPAYDHTCNMFVVAVSATLVCDAVLISMGMRWAAGRWLAVHGGHGRGGSVLLYMAVSVEWQLLRSTL